LHIQILQLGPRSIFVFYLHLALFRLEEEAKRRAKVARWQRIRESSLQHVRADASRNPFEERLTPDPPTYVWTDDAGREYWLGSVYAVQSDQSAAAFDIFIDCLGDSGWHVGSS